MKKLVFVTAAIVFGIITGMIIIIVSNNVKDRNNSELLGYEVGEEDIKNNTLVEASKNETKISPNATLIMQKKYKKCGHTIEDIVEIPYDVVNKTKEEFEETYKDWQIEKFFEKEIAIYKAIEGICNEHYVLREKDGFVAIYVKDEAEEERLVEITEIPTQYLPDIDLQSLQEGITLYGREKLNHMLEDFE